MSRYVKADMIGCPCGYCEGYDECQKEVDEAPSIDIVRCGECKYKDDIVNYCYENDRSINDDDFCSYGERKGECKECWHWSEVHKRCENKCGCQFKPYGEREGE